MNDELFLVDKIVAERVASHKDGKTFPEFYIKWLGYDDENKFNTCWDPVFNLASLESDIAQFRKEKVVLLEQERERKEKEEEATIDGAAKDARESASECVEIDPDAPIFIPIYQAWQTHLPLLGLL
eukprot:gene16254-19289_t